MPRKRSDDKEQSDGFNKAFPKTLRKLMDERNVTQKMLADYLGKKTRQTVSYYCDGTSSPDWETLVKIADYFNISVDYLLGRTLEPRRKPSAADELGLSSSAVFNLRRFCTEPLEPGKVTDFASIINALLEQSDFFLMVKEIADLQGEIIHVSDDMQKEIEAYTLNDHGISDGLRKATFRQITRDRVESIRKCISENYDKDIATRFQVLCGSEAIEYSKRKINNRFDRILSRITNYTEFIDKVVTIDKRDIFHFNGEEFVR